MESEVEASPPDPLSEREGRKEDRLQISVSAEMVVLVVKVEISTNQILKNEIVSYTKSLIYK